MTLEELLFRISKYNSDLNEMFNPGEGTLQSLLNCLNRIEGLGDRTLEEAFSKGAGRFFNDADFAKYYGTAPVYENHGTLYLIPKDELEIMYQECGNDTNALEFLTGIHQGRLDDQYVIMEVDNMDGLTVYKPTGEEYAANAAYDPNGLPGGTKEGLIDNLPNPVQNGSGHVDLCDTNGERININEYALEAAVEEEAEEEEESEENGTVEVETEVKVEEKTTVEETEDSVTVTSETTTTTTTTT
ncbi:MAG: hypothetical protein II642_08200, partial [Firmicutes bacterium]|nr:hypothetical protein [Bacillota bacterium]